MTLNEKKCWKYLAVMKKILCVLLFVVVFGCGQQRSFVGSSDKSRLELGKEKKWSVWCMEGDKEVEYEWVMVDDSEMPYNTVKGLWDFVGLRMRDNVVVRIVSNRCRVSMRVFKGGV